MKQRQTVTKEQLRDRAYAAAYLQERAQKGPGGLYSALREVVHAREGGFAWLAKRTGLGRASLYKALSEDGNPSFITIHRVLEALGLDLAVDATHKTMKPNNMYNSSVVMDRSSEAYTALPQAEQAPAKVRIQPGSAKGITCFMAEDFNAPVSDDLEQERFRALTQELYAECDAVEREPGAFTDPVKAGVAAMILDKHRRKGLEL